MNQRCANCNRRADFIYLDEQGNCLTCSQIHGFDDKEIVFAQMVSDKQGEYTLEEWTAITEVLGDVEFGCRFDETGGCKLTTMSDKRACCSSCFTMFGYLKTIPHEALKICIENFKRGNGFWTKTGCALPWKYRSSTCLIYRCPQVRVNEDKEVWVPMYKAVGLGERQFLPLLENLPRRIS